MDAEITNSTFVLPATSTHSSVSVARPVGTVICLAVADTCAIVSATLVSSHVREVFIGGPTASIPELALTHTIFTICSFIAARLYPGVCENPVEELRRTIHAITLAFLCLGASTFVSHDLSQSRFIVVLAYMVTLLFVPLFRGFVRAAFANQPWWGCPVVIMGLGETGQRVLKTLTENPRFGLKPIAVLDDDPTTYENISPDLIAGPLSSCFDITREHRISYGILCMPGLSKNELLKLLNCYGQCFSHVMVIPDLIGMATMGLGIREVGGIIGLEVTQRLLRPWAQRAKRLIDLFITVPVTLLVLPALALAALLIKLESEGPVFYRNERIGYRGRKFGAWKLRSMVVNGDEVLQKYLDAHPGEKPAWEHTQKLKRDPRVTRIGKIIRKTSIDELPQLWNVLRGEMSIVGPRPFLQSQIEMYGPTFELYKRVRPGITGLWQISGRNQLAFSERVRLDAYLIQNWSVWLDVYIIGRTVMTVLTARGAY
jgi:Undecaprenyl-phosphate galactose phosphotransferase WbaP